MFVISSNNSLDLATELATILKIELVLPEVIKFKNSEMAIKILKNFDSQTVIIVSSTSTHINDSFIEICLLINASKNAGANKIIVIVPYFSYLRQNQKENNNPVHLMVNLLKTAGADLIITMDTHAAIDPNLRSTLVSLDTCDLFLENLTLVPRDTVVIAPDLGAANRAKNLASALELPFVIATKHRLQDKILFDLNFKEVANKNCIIIDDMIDSGNTIYYLAELLQKYECILNCCITHPIFSKGSLELLNKIRFKQFFVCNTIKQNLPSNIITINIIPKIAAYLISKKF